MAGISAAVRHFRQEHIAHACKKQKKKSVKFAFQLHVPRCNDLKLSQQIQVRLINYTASSINNIDQKCLPKSVTSC